MIDRRSLFRTAWRNARLEAGTRYGITLSLRHAFAIELRKAWRALKEAAVRSARIASGIAQGAAELRSLAAAGAFKSSWTPRNTWRFANANPCGGGL